MNSLPNEQPIQFIRLREVKELTGIGTTKIYDMANKGTFPKQIKLGSRSVAWIKSEVLAWNREQVVRSRGHVVLPVSDDQQPTNKRR